MSCIARYKYLLKLFSLSLVLRNNFGNSSRIKSGYGSEIDGCCGTWYCCDFRGHDFHFQRHGDQIAERDTYADRYQNDYGIANTRISI